LQYNLHQSSRKEISYRSVRMYSILSSNTRTTILLRSVASNMCSAFTLTLISQPKAYMLFLTYALQTQPQHYQQLGQLANMSSRGPCPGAGEQGTVTLRCLLQPLHPGLREQPGYRSIFTVPHL